MTQQSHHWIYTEKITILKDTCTPVFTVAIFTIVRTWKPPRCSSTDEWKNNMWSIYVMEYHSAIKINDCESVVLR